MSARFNPAPGWPPTPEGWTPPPGWQPDPAWPPAPPGWQFWVEDAPGAVPLNEQAPSAPSPGGPAPSAPSGEQVPDATQVLPSQSPGSPSSGSPSPSAPSAPESARGVPPAVPPARYAQAPDPHQQAPGPYQSGHPAPGQYQPGQPSNGWNSPPTGGKRNHLVWILPVAALVLIGIVFGALALAGVFSDDEPGTSATASPTEPTPEPTEPDPTEPAPESPTEPAPEPTTDPGAEVDPVVAAFCADNAELATRNADLDSAETVGDAIPVLEAMVDEMAPIVAPAEIADAWAFNVTFTQEMLDFMRDQDPAGSNIDAQVDFFENHVDPDELSNAVDELVAFVMANCS